MDDINPSTTFFIITYSTNLNSSPQNNKSKGKEIIPNSPNKASSINTNYLLENQLTPNHKNKNKGKWPLRSFAFVSFNIFPFLPSFYLYGFFLNQIVRMSMA